MHLTLFTGGHAPGMVLLIGNVGAYCCADGNTCFYVVELNTIFNCFVSKGICVFHCVIGELEKVVILKPVDMLNALSFLQTGQNSSLLCFIITFRFSDLITESY